MAKTPNKQPNNDRKTPKEKGFLLINEETIPVLYYKDQFGATLKLRDMSGVLGTWLSVESGKVKQSPPALLRRLRAGNVVNL